MQKGLEKLKEEMRSHWKVLVENGLREPGSSGDLLPEDSLKNNDFDSISSKSSADVQVANEIVGKIEDAVRATVKFPLNYYRETEEKLQKTLAAMLDADMKDDAAFEK